MNKILVSFALFICTLLTVKASAIPFYEQNSGMYVGGLGGVNWLNFHKKDETKVHVKTGYYAGGVIGYRFTEPYRIEGEVSYRRNNLKHVKYFGSTYKGHGHIRTFAAMGNVYSDFNWHPLIRPYIGVGFGYARLYNQLNFQEYKRKHHENGVAYQGMVGINYLICENVDLGTEFKYFRARNKVRDYTLGFSIKHYF